MPFFFIPLTTLALGAVEEDEVASAAGLMNFLRTMSGAIATAIGVTMWENGAQSDAQPLTGVLNGTLDHAGAPGARLQRRAIAPVRQPARRRPGHRGHHRFALLLAAALFIGAAAIIWLAPKPKHAVAMGGH